MQQVPTHVRRAGLALIAVAFAGPSFGQAPFSWEVGGALLASRAEQTVPVFDVINGEVVPVGSQTFRSEFDEVTLDGVRYFAPIAPGGGPLARAAFLSRASSLGVGIVASDTGGDATDQDGRAARVGLLLVSPEQGWTFGAAGSYGRSEVLQGTFRTRIATVDVGRYIGERAAIRVGAVRTWARQDLPGFTGKVTVDSQFAQLELVGDLTREWDYALDVAWRLGESGLENAQLEARGTLFPNPMLGIGAEFTASTGNPSGRARTYGLFGRWFVTERWSASLRYGWFDDDRRVEFEMEAYNWTLGVRRRF